MKVEILNPKGYCSGVTNAIYIARRARKEHPECKVFVLGKLVHNDEVVSKLEKEDIITLFDKKLSHEELLKTIPEGSVVIFTAHGHDEKLDAVAKDKNLIIYNAICPKVQNNFNKIKEEISASHEVIFIGQNGHPETVAALSINEKVSLYDTKLLINYQNITDKSPYVVNQTTLNFLSISSIHKSILDNIPNARIENEICDTTRLRQEAVQNLPNDVDLIIIVGDKFSSNSNKLYEIAKITHKNVDSTMISTLSELDINLLQNKNHIVISSGASTPQETIDMIHDYIVNFK